MPALENDVNVDNYSCDNEDDERNDKDDDGCADDEDNNVDHKVASNHYVCTYAAADALVRRSALPSRGSDWSRLQLDGCLLCWRLSLWLVKWLRMRAQLDRVSVQQEALGERRTRL